MESISDQDIRDRCALCKSMPCCPEHCCNWDNCKCSDCEYCRGNQHASGDQVVADPGILIKATGQEQVTKLNTKRKPTFKHSKQKDEGDEEKPQEQTQTSDGALITNFEVPLEEDVTMYSGGVKGIRALRQQRDLYQEGSQQEESKR